MTSHDLARRLLAMPDLPVIARNDCLEFEIVALYHEEDADYVAAMNEPQRSGPAISLADCHDARYQRRVGGAA